MSLQNRLDAAIDAALGDRIVGCVVLVNQDGKEIYARAAGLADREANRKIERDAIFRLASITKPIVAAAAMTLVEDGVIAPADPVAAWLPELASPVPSSPSRKLSASSR